MPEDGRTRQGKVDRLRAAVRDAARRILGKDAEGTVQLLVVDLTTHEAIQVAALPAKAVKGRKLHRDRLSLTVSNHAIAVRQFDAAAARWQAVEEAKAGAADLAAGPG